jgi:hypothetical protein
MNVCGRATARPHMQLETKYLRLPIAVTVGSYFGDWQVCWSGGWSRHRLFYLVMLVRVRADRVANESEAR